MKFAIYLAGPITGMTWDQALSWRETATLRLGPLYHILNPISPQKFDIKSRQDIVEHNPRDATGLPLHFTGSGIVTSDELYVRKSDIIFSNFLNAPNVSPGTLWEMGLAWGLGKQLITVVDEGNPNDIIFVRRRSHIFVPTAEEAIDYLEKVASHV